MSHTRASADLQACLVPHGTPFVRAQVGDVADDPETTFSLVLFTATAILTGASIDAAVS